ncbi:MAG: cobalamin-binding protein [Betaproteobacteria bacterium]
MLEASWVAAQPVGLIRDAGPQSLASIAPAARVVTLAPSLTELVFAASGGDRLVGVSAYSDYPAEARALPQIADAAGLSWESLIALKPDLVLAWKDGTRPADIARLNALGIRVSVIEIKRLADVPRGLRTIGTLLGRPAPAGVAAEAYERQLTALRVANAGKPLIRAFVEISRNPLMTINGDHVISEMISLCGGMNIFADRPGVTSEPSREEMLVRKPDAILFGRSRDADQPLNWSVYAGLPAIREGRIYGITADYAFRPGPRLIKAVAQICDAMDRGRAAMKRGRPAKYAG